MPPEQQDVDARRASMIRVVIWSTVVAGALVAYTRWGTEDDPPVWPAQWIASAAATFLMLTLWQVVTGRETRPLLPWVFAGQALAALPDLLARLGIDHARWMDLFALHATIESERIPVAVSFAGLLGAAGVFLVGGRVAWRRR